MTRRDYILQRVTAGILAPLVLLHLAIMIYAVQDGLTGAEILARTRGNIAWMAFYGVFVVAAALHGGIGLANVLREWTRLSPAVARGIGHGFTLAALAFGLRAVIAVTAG